MKLAFCFLSRGDIAHQRTWSAFFRDAPPDAYGIWLHRADRGMASRLPGVTCVPSHGTSRAMFSIVNAQQVLFQVACRDPAVTKCILLSGDSVPVQSFEAVAASMLSHPKGILAWETELSDVQASRSHLARRDLWPKDWKWEWRAAAQWCVLTREHVGLLASYWGLVLHTFFSTHTADEHVYPVFFEGVGRLDSFVRQPFMFVDWGDPTTATHCGLPHNLYPRTFHAEDCTPALLRRLRSGGYATMRKVCERWDCPPLWTGGDQGA
jgi:Core-2/I-Branching enzyme